MSHAYSRLHYHIILSTKERQRLMSRDVKDRLYGYLIGIVNNLDGVVEAIGGVEDHIHLLAYCPPKLALAEFIGKLKANSSGWVHETWPERKAFGWQRGYGAFTVSESNVPAVKEYIENQEEHHRRMTFQEELRILFDKHGIEYDEYELWN
jgi:putative transposase